MHYFLESAIQTALSSKHIPFNMLYNNDLGWGARYGAGGVSLITFDSVLGLDFQAVIACGIRPLGAYDTTKKLKPGGVLSDEMAEKIKQNISYTSFDEVIAAYTQDPALFSATSVKLVPVYKKIAIHSNDFSISFRPAKLLDETGTFGFVDENHGLNRQVDSYLQDLQSNIPLDPEAMTRIIKEPVRVEHLLSESSFRDYQQRYANKKVEMQNQNWRLYFDISVRKVKGQFLVSVCFVNNSQVLYSQSHKSRKKDKSSIETLFNSGINIKLFNAKYCPIELDFFADDYKYDKKQYALSNKCSVEFNASDNSLQTNHLPLYKQYRLSTYDNIQQTFVDYYRSGNQEDLLISYIAHYRKSIYASDNYLQIYFVDLLYAVIKRSVAKSSWKLLPEYSNMEISKWTPYLNDTGSIKMLWPSQQLIGKMGILRGEMLY